MEYCENYTSVLQGQKPTDNDITYIYRTRCKQWSCDYCANINRRIWMARIVIETCGDVQGTWHFWTLTLDADDHDRGIGHSLTVWRSQWDKLLKRIRRMAQPRKLRYLRVFETHADGTLHIHMLADYAPSDVRKTTRYNKKRDKNIDVYVSNTLRDVLTDLDLGWVHDVRPMVKSRDMTTEVSIAAYLGKYLTKDMQSSARADLRVAGMGRIRMIQTSQAWAKLDQDASDVDWRLAGSVSMSLVMLLRDRGIFYYDLNRREFLDEWHAQADYWPNHRFEIIMNQVDNID